MTAPDPNVAVPTRVVITGGGTAGHTNPGIAIAQALVEAGVDPAAIHFIGGERGAEGTSVPAAGFTIDVLPGRGLLRSLRPAAIRANLVSGVGLVQGLRHAWRLLGARRPAVVVCLGGYAAFPASFAALIRRIPVVVSEQNARASAVNRLIGRWAAVNALPYPDTDLPRGTLTGNPIRAELLTAIDAADRAQSRRALGIPEGRVMVAVWSGSLGARRINDAIPALAERWRDRSDLSVYHIVGRRDWSDFAGAPAAMADASLHYQTVEYEQRMAYVLTAADVAITRAGASTTAELAAAGLPAVLVPLPGAPRDHQRANAVELEDAGAAIVIDDADISDELLAGLLEPIIASPDRIVSMAAAAISVGRPHAARDVAELILAVERGEH